MKKLIVITLSLALLGAITTQAFAGGDKQQGDKGQGTVSQGDIGEEEGGDVTQEQAGR
ncbi:MAG: hypothetical protein KJ957_00130 [Candidatus Omnitrophica bacterium]|nr:hypothetical protein [Candidatus Omnitrophota bacterium]MBU1852435.1 hypothetical protein [Candidatus Omnitrophota bacterium]